MGFVSILLALFFAPFISTLFIDFIISLLVGSVSLGLFVIIQRRVAVPLVDLKVMSHKVIVLGNISLFSFGIFQYPDISNCSYTWTESYFYRGVLALTL